MEYVIDLLIREQIKYQSDDEENLVLNENEVWNWLSYSFHNYWTGRQRMIELPCAIARFEVISNL